MEYAKLDESTVIDYVKSVGLFEGDEPLEASEIGDGNINMVFRVVSPRGARPVIVKQAYPYVRCVGESWPLSQDRIRIEAEAMEEEARLAPGLVPAIYHKDTDMALMALEDLSYLGVMRGQMLTMTEFPLFAEHISTFLANTLYYTSDMYMDPAEKKAMVGRFINPDLCRITEDLIFSDPYIDHERNNINPALRPYLEEVFWRKRHLRLAASRFKYKFLTRAECLLHGDLHTGSIFASPEETKVFDSEFAFVGPMAFDPGLLIGNLLINYVSWSGKRDRFAPDAIAAYRRHVEEMINAIYRLFEEKFVANWNGAPHDVIATTDGFRRCFMRELFVDAVGYAGLVMIRRMHGLAHNADVDEIEDEALRRDVQVDILEIAEELILNRASFATIDEVTATVRERIAR